MVLTESGIAQHAHADVPPLWRAIRYDDPALILPLNCAAV